MANVVMDPSWAGRRRVVRCSLSACLGLALYSMYLGVPMAAVVITPVTLLAGSIIGSYVFGAAWERTSGIPSGNKQA